MVEIDGTYYSSLLIVDYYKKQSDLILKNIVDSNLNINISIFYEKKDPYKIVRKLTYNIGNMAIEEKNSKNNSEVELLESTFDDARYIRKEIQVNGEEIYYIYLYVTIFTDNTEELELVLNILEGILFNSGMRTRRAYFRQEQVFFSTLPFNINKPEIKEATKRNILTKGIIGTYPFISSSIFDEKGVFIGRNSYNNSLVFIDKYNKEIYKNANMCIFGTSGAGKSFYTKLNILRYSLLDIYQYVIDPEREYGKLCEELDGLLIKLGPTADTYINILDIREESLEKGEKGYLSLKISRLIGFFNLIFGELNEEEKAIIEEKLIKVYKEKGISFDDDTLYKIKEGKKVFKKGKDMPILEDLYNIFEKDKKTSNFKIKLVPFIKGSLKFFNNYTNIELKNKLIVADIYDLGEENLKYGMYLFTEFFWDLIRINRKIKKAIYMDEIWRLIGITSNKDVASFIYTIFKTIRKYGGSAVAITQDVSDLFSLENGTYGKAILNNTSIKNFFSLEEENIKILEKFVNLSMEEKIQIKNLQKGEVLIFAEKDHISCKVEAAAFEKEIIE